MARTALARGSFVEVERANTKHSRHLDEQMRREVLAFLQGPPTGGARTHDWRDAEPLGGDDEPRISPFPHLDPVSLGGNSNHLSPAVREQRSRLGVFLPRSVFPCRRSALIAAAAAANAPDDLIAELGRLPEEDTFGSLPEVWMRLGYARDQRF
ncbi:MAG TPA: DUF2795 domain-containing protein [Micromonosporaceae bacterium]|nr:DUF2795 domain-containing protein [Micromonosporaceae bacterium]